MESWKRSELAGYGSYGIVVGTVAILLLLPVGGTLASTTSQPREIPTGTSDTTSYTPSTWAFAQYSERGVSSLGQPPSSRSRWGLRHCQAQTRWTVPGAEDRVTTRASITTQRVNR